LRELGYEKDMKWWRIIVFLFVEKEERR